jgi:hypothetical protein
MRFVDSCSTIHLSSPPTRVCLTRFVPPSGFLTLSMACSSTGCPALFHAGALMESCPFRAFPSPGAVPPLGGLCPPAVHPAEPRRRSFDHRNPRRRATQHSSAVRDSPTSLFTAATTVRSRRIRLQGLAPRSESVVIAGRVRHPRRPVLSWGSRPHLDHLPHCRAPVRIPDGSGVPGLRGTCGPPRRSYRPCTARLHVGRHLALVAFPGRSSWPAAEAAGCEGWPRGCSPAPAAKPFVEPPTAGFRRSGTIGRW